VGLFDDILEEKKRPEASPRPQVGLFDDIIAEPTSNAQAQPFQASKPSGIFDDIIGKESPQPDDSSFVGALGRGAARSAIPTGAGIVGGALAGAAIAFLSSRKLFRI